MNNEKRIADQLEKYLDNQALDGSGLDPATREIADTLLKASVRDQPRPGFVNELAQQLREKELLMNENPSSNGTSRLLRAAFSAIAFVALIVLTLYASR